MYESATQNVNLQTDDREIVLQYARPRGLSFSAALRMIIREWHEQKQSDLTPAQQVVEELRGEM